MFNGSGPHVLDQREASEDYGWLMEMVVHDPDLEAISHNRFNEILLSELKQSIGAARNRSSSELCLGVILAPDHFRSRQSAWVLDRLLETNDLSPVKYPWRTKLAYMGAIMSHPIEDCSRLYLDAARGEDDFENVLLFKQAFGRYFVAQGFVWYWGAAYDYQDVCRSCEALNITSIEGFIRDSRLDEFVDYIDSVVFSSDDRDESFTPVIQLLENEFPHLYARIKPKLHDYSVVNAIGAACMARQIVIHSDIVSRYSRDEGQAVFEHDEL